MSRIQYNAMFSSLNLSMWGYLPCPVLLLFSLGLSCCFEICFEVDSWVCYLFMGVMSEFQSHALSRSKRVRHFWNLDDVAVSWPTGHRSFCNKISTKSVKKTRYHINKHFLPIFFNFIISNLWTCTSKILMTKIISNCQLNV